MNTILETIGIEIESVGLTRSQVADIIAMSDCTDYIRLDRDASVEFRAGALPDSRIFVNAHSNEFRDLNSRGDLPTFGYEVTTVPLTVPQMEKVMWKFLSRLNSSGDFVHHRAALHIHVGFGVNLKILKRAMNFGLRLDPLLFRMAGMGRQFRGELNNNTYCRPLLCGATVRGESYYYRILDPYSAIKSETTEQFWNHYALDPNQEINRYHPGRYFGFNLFSTLLHGTLEFRHFNQTLSPLLLISTAKLVRGLAELLFYCDDMFVENMEQLDVFKEYEISTYENFLVYLLEQIRELELEYIPNNKEIQVLMDNLRNTPHHKIKDENVGTHIREFVLRDKFLKTANFHRMSKPKPPEFTDIHNIGSDFSILD